MSEIKWLWEDYDWVAVHGLLKNAFAEMEGRIDPPSSLQRLTPEAIAEFAQDHSIIVMEEAPDHPVACIFLSAKGDALYIGKMAVAPLHRGRGYAAQLLNCATHRARDLDLSHLELQTRVELTENHAIFASLGFVETGQTTHEGFDKPTSITMRRAL